MPSPEAKKGIGNIKPHMLKEDGADLPPVSIALNSNENAYGPSQSAIAAAQAAALNLERYYEAPQSVLAPALAEAYDLEAERIAIGQGSDDLLARLARAYLQPGSEMIRSANGYLKTPNYAYANDAVPVSAPDHDFTPSVDAILEKLSEKTRMVYLANPENPAGTHLSGKEVRRLHAGLPDHVLLVLDCAYEEYVDAPDYEPGDVLVAEAQNVVMTRTFSKIHGLAGARMGWLYGPEEIVETVSKIGLMFPVASPSISACLAALEDKAHVGMVYERTVRARRSLKSDLTELGLKVYPSQTNFLLVEFPDPARSAENACSNLRRKGIAVRRFANPAYKHCLRITLGFDSELKTATRAIAAFLAGEN